MSPSSPAGSSSSASTLPISNTLLALPDGPIPEGHADRSSYSISYIGGYPSFPSGVDVPSEVKCGACHQPIPLLAQVYCPPEGGENDRTVYVWGCSKRKCQRREGSVRAFRASKRNEEYARDVEEKRIEAEKEAEQAREKARINPFSMPNGQPSSLFGTPQPLFGASASPFGAPTPAPASAPAPASTSETPDIAKLSISSPAGLATAVLGPPLPAYQPPQYLTTIGEYIPPLEDIEMEEDDDEKDEYGPEIAEIKDDKWDKILPKTVDEVFETFARKLQSAEDGEQQVLRYELGGVPLPYASSSPLFKKLFPKAPNMAPKPQGDEEDIDVSPYYDPSAVPPCPKCSSARVFEMQLVPSLITLLTPESMTTTGQKAGKQSKKTLTEAERKEELKRLAKGENEGDQGEMEWGTVMVFGCERDCTGFTEEWVGVEWETPGA